MQLFSELRGPLTASELGIHQRDRTPSLVRERLPPLAERFRIVSSSSDQRKRGKLMRIAGTVAVFFPAKHSIAGDSQLSQSLSDEIRNHTEIFGDDAGGLCQDAEQFFALGPLARLIGGNEVPIGVFRGTNPLSEISHRVIDAP